VYRNVVSRHGLIPGGDLPTLNRQFRDFPIRRQRKFPFMTTVCLFDIDGTLLNSGGAGQHAMEQALAEVFGVTGPYEDIPAAGRTDRAITTDLFAHHRLDLNEARFAEFLESYLSHLPRSLAALDGRVLPGIESLLNLLSESPDRALGLLTGNFEIAAELKLRHYRLDHHFHFGGYGDDHFNRDDVARRALEDASRHLARELHADRVWVIGDTPSDIRCARAIGAKVIAVATGIFSAAELEAAKPDALFETLEPTEEVVRLLS